MTRKRPYTKYLRLVADNDQRIDEMAAFDRDIEIDAALDRIITDLRQQPDLTADRRRTLIQAWLQDLSKEPRQ
jgi:hypothetical protein